MENTETQVLIIGSGFGASVAALRFSEAGKQVTILEKGGWINREDFEVDGNMFWMPNKGYYGMNRIEKMGRHIVPWLGVGVGGGSHVYAGTLKRRVFFDDFPGNITVDQMQPYYDRAERMMQAVKYPDYPPYNKLPSYCVFREAEKKLQNKYPELVEKQGDVLLAISYAPEGVEPGTKFINKYGAPQQYSDPDEQTILGGDIDVKNTLDKNYLFLAKNKGAEIKEFSEAYKIETIADKRYKVYYKNPKNPDGPHSSIICDILICGAGSIGSTELLLQNKSQFKTLSNLSSSLGKGYYTNGDYITFMITKKGLLISWIGVITAVLGWIFSIAFLGIAGALIYLMGWLLSQKKSEPDKGTTNSDYIRFKHKDGSTQGYYIEGGRYPTPTKAFIAIIMSLGGNFHPVDYGPISKVINFMGKYVPVFELIERSWPIPLLMMGRDDAKGEFILDENNEVKIKFPFESNKDYYRHLEKLGKMLAEEADSYFFPNWIASLLKLVEVPHNIGGVPMGDSIENGVVDSFGRVFGYKNFMVLDGSILPISVGPNPVDTILAFSERGVETAISQLEKHGTISAEELKD